MRGALLPIGFVAVLCTGCAPAPADEAGAPDGRLHLRVLAIHDFHGALLPAAYSWSRGRSVGGAAALKWVMDSLETACGCPTLRVDGGDQMQGTLESNLVHGASVVAAFNRLDLDAAAIGNHELDWGIDTFLVRRNEADYAWLAANVVQVMDGKRPPWAWPSLVVDRAGVRVGIVGYATTDTPRTLRPVITAPYSFLSGYDGVRDAIEAAWQDTPDFVLIVAHAGGDCRDGSCTGEMIDLARNVPPGRVHLILGGHVHTPGAGEVNGIPVVRAGSHGRAVAVVDLYRHLDGRYEVDYDFVPVEGDGAREDVAMLDLLAPYVADAEVLGMRHVTTLAERLAASPVGDRRLGYLIAESARRMADADVGLHNPGGVRADLSAGEVTYGDLFRVLPFGNDVVRLRLDGRQFRALLAQASDRYYFTRRPDGEVVEESHTILMLDRANAAYLADRDTIVLATNRFLADGGDGFRTLAELPREVLGAKMLDAVVEYLLQLAEPVALSVEEHVLEPAR